MRWSWAAASSIGTSHVRTGGRCDDAHRCLEVDGTLVAIVSDGAGSAPRGAQGAALVCRTLALEFAAALRLWGMPSDDAVEAAFDRARDRIAHAASLSGLTMRDFAATSVAVLAGADETVVAHVGDGAAAVREADGSWRAASWPAAGEFAGTTFFVTDDGGARLRIARLGVPVAQLAVLTDGLERLALSFAGDQAHAPFFEGMMRPLAARESAGRSAEVSAMLRSYLGSEAVCSRTDDDKTLVLARRL